MNIDKAVAVAIKRARESPKQKAKHCAVSLLNNKLIAIAVNSRRSSWLQRLYANKVGAPKKVCEHAEVGVIRKSRELDTLIVVRVNEIGELRSSSPCPICRALIKDSSVKHLYYSTNSGIEYERL